MSTKNIATAFQVKHLMSSTLVTLCPDDSLKALQETFRSRSIRHVPIVDKKGNLVGLITQRDFLTVAVSKLAHVAQDELDDIYGKLTVGEIMGKKVVSVSPDLPLAEAAALMFENKFGCLPVTRKKRLVGILTEADFVRAFMSPAELSRRQRFSGSSRESVRD